MNEYLPIFVNPRAGSANNRHEDLETTFRAAGAQPAIKETRGQTLETAIRSEVEAGARLIGIAGGDGTISAAANVLVDCNAALLPIPLGTLNHFAQRYGIASVDAAAHAWQHRSVHGVHVGCVNNRIFINNASCGFYPNVVRLREGLEKALPRAIAMWTAGFAVLAKHPMLELDIDAGGSHRRIQTPALWVGIGANSLRLPLPGDTHQSAVLEAVSGRAETRATSIALAFRLFWKLKRGIQPSDDRLDVVRAPAFTVRSRKAIDVALDGEPLAMRGPLTFSLREKALQVMCLVAPTE